MLIPALKSLIESVVFSDKPHLTIRDAMIRIVTIEREYGCGAAGIAQELAARLGWKLWDQMLTQEIARFAHCNQSDVKQREELQEQFCEQLA
jgi:predicted double-glycine peptidase